MPSPTRATPAATAAAVAVVRAPAAPDRGTSPPRRIPARAPTRAGRCPSSPLRARPPPRGPPGPRVSPCARARKVAMTEPGTPALQPGLVVAALTPFLGDSVRVDHRRLAGQVETVAAYAPSAISVAGVESQEFQVLGRRARLAMLDTVVA